MNFGDKIKRICKLEGINLKEFSDLTEIPYQSLKNYTAGRRSPKFSQIEKISSHKRFTKYKDLLFRVSGEFQPDTVYDSIISPSIKSRAENLASSLGDINTNDSLLLINQFEALIDTYHKTKRLIKIQERSISGEYSDQED